MKQSKTTLKELTAAYRAVLRYGILCNAIALGSLVAPAIAEVLPAETQKNVFVLGDVSLTDQHVIYNQAAFAGRRMNVGDTLANGLGGYRNDFPKYKMVARSFAMSDSDTYVGPVTLNLRELNLEGDNADVLTFNYQQDVGGDWKDVLLTKEMIPVLDWNTTTDALLATGLFGQSTAWTMATYSILNENAQAGSLNFDNVDAVVDGATINANEINITNGSTITFVNGKSDDDTTALDLLNSIDTTFTDKDDYRTKRFYTEAAYIDTDGKTALNADTINIDGSLVRVNADAELTMMANNIVITGESAASDQDKKNPTKYLVLVDGDNSVLNLGSAENPVNSIDIRHTGYDARALTIWENAEANIYGIFINIEGDSYGVTAWPTLGKTTAALNIVGYDIDIASANGIGLLSEEGADVSVRGHTVAFSGGANALQASDEGTIHVVADNLTVSGYDGILANYKKGQITIESTGDVNIIAEDAAIHAGFGSADVTKAKADTSFVDIKAKNINLTADETGIEAMSNGWIDLDGNLTVNAKNAILARGYATVNVNESGRNTVKLNGDVNFNFYSNPGSSGNSGSVIDAYVNVNLTNAQSYWTGNTVVDYLYDNRPEDRYFEVNNFNLSLSNGAVWNATKITDTNQTIVDEETHQERTTGKYYTALNNLEINQGTVNIKDMDRGIIVENASLADATFNGGDLNIGNMTLISGTNTFNNNVNGVDSASALTVNSGATMNIGTHNVDVSKITLNGDMLATLRSGDTAQITAGTFTGNGTLKLTMKEAGTYKVFGDKSFANIAWDESGLTTSSPIYNLTWDGGDVIATRKTIEEIATDNNVSDETAATVAHLTDSSSDKLNELAIKMQEKLAEGTPEAKAEVEHATTAIHPEKESVVQSVATSVQNTVTNLASARMGAPMIGRNGGDIKLTSGGVWAQGLFNKAKNRGAFDGYTRGIAFGLDGNFNKHFTLGAGYAYAHSDVDGSKRDTEIDSNTVFVYGQYKPTQWYANAILNYTWSDYSESGDALGILVKSDYDVDSYGAAIATGYDFKSGLTPELGLRYLHVNAEDYVNSSDVKTSLKDNDFLTAVFGTKYALNVVADRYTTFVPQLNAAIKYDLLSDKNTATVTLPGVDSYSLDGKRLSRVGGEFGFGLGMKHRNLDFSVNYDIEVRDEYTSQTGMFKFRCNF